MSRKGAVESFQVKITRNDRFAQMSHQEKVIEQKKKEIQAKLEQKQKSLAAAADSKSNTSSTKQDKKYVFVTHIYCNALTVCYSTPDSKKLAANFNVFSNDGSFLDQFKQMKEKKLDQKLKSFKRENQEKHNR